MITNPFDVLKEFPVRKSRKQKQSFHDAAIPYIRNLGYTVTVESGGMGAQNIVIGDTQQAKYLITAHYDTPASIGLPNFISPCNLPVYLLVQLLVIGVFLLLAFLIGLIASIFTSNEGIIFLCGYIGYFGLLLLMLFGPANPNNANDNTSGVVTLLQLAQQMPQHLRSQVCFVLFDLEESGLIGSASYRKAHKAATENQIVLNLDCVGDGDEIVAFLTAKLRKDSQKLDSLSILAREQGSKKLWIHKKGFAHCPSDQGNFPYGVGIMAFRRMPVVGIYCDRIHTWRDTILDEENVRFITETLLALLSENTKNEHGS